MIRTQCRRGEKVNKEAIVIGTVTWFSREQGQGFIAVDGAKTSSSTSERCRTGACRP
jgi:hypothetical protein